MPGIAHDAGVTVEECQAALVKFTSPDPFSRNKSNDGRRIEEIPGGWRVLNHFCYLDDKEEQRREYQREYMRHRRERLKMKQEQDDADAYDRGLPVKSAKSRGSHPFGASPRVVECAPEPEPEPDPEREASE